MFYQRAGGAGSRALSLPTAFDLELIHYLFGLQKQAFLFFNLIKII